MNWKRTMGEHNAECYLVVHVVTHSDDTLTEKRFVGLAVADRNPPKNTDEAEKLNA